MMLKNLIFCFFLGIVSSELRCRHKPLEFGIALDSSKTVLDRGFQQSKDFLKKYLGQFNIGTDRNDIRVSIITFGRGVYEQDAFNLNTYTNKEDVLKAIMRLHWQKGGRTDTGMAIEYMRKNQLTRALMRPFATQRVGLVITDGLSTVPRVTKIQAKLAREDGITMYALGVGNVNMQELETIAGSMSRVMRVENYDALNSALKGLTTMICEKITTTTTTTTTPPPKNEKCGDENPADINFIFSPSDLGLDSTAWTSSFISHVMDVEQMSEGFQFGFITGSCPRNIPLDYFKNVKDVKRYTLQYDRYRLPDLAQFAKEEGFSAANGGRRSVKKVAVLFVNEEKIQKGGFVQARAMALKLSGVEVFIANPQGSPIRVRGAKPLQGGSSFEQAAEFVHNLCPSEFFS